MSDINSSINNLVGTFASINTGGSDPIPDQMVCIDTSNNRIGINTIDPSYAIHVVDGTICTNNLIVTNSIDIANSVFLNIPNSPTGLITGQLYHETGTLKIVL